MVVRCTAGGNPDEIVWRFGLDRAAQIRAVRHGDADWMFQGTPADRWTEIRNHDVAQLHVNDMPQTDFLLMRTEVPPFNDIRARRAFNLAIDRRVVVTAYGGSDQAAPTCQVLPPGETARVTFCPYTRDDSPDGGWSAPDLSRAQRLVADSGTRGMKVTVLGISDSPYPPAEVAQVAARTLRQLGYRAHLRMMTQAEFDRLPAKERNAFDVSPFAWYADFPSPSTFFQTIFACDAPLIHGRTCDLTLDRQIHSALRNEANSLGSQDTTWAAVGRRATSQALTVPLVNPRAVELTSSRLHGYEYNPLWGFLPAQSNLR